MFFTISYLRFASAISVWVADSHHLFQLGGRGSPKHSVCDPPFSLIALINLYTFDTKSLKLILS